MGGYWQASGRFWQGLPEILALVVLLGAERRVVEILEAEEFHRGERLVFLPLNFLASLWSEEMNSL